MDDYYEKMREHLDLYDQSQVKGLTSRDVVAKNYTDGELRELIRQLGDRPLTTTSAFQVEAFIFERQEDRIPIHLRRKAADRLVDCLSSDRAVASALASRIFLAWGGHRSDYRATCSRLLQHADPTVRWTALSYAGSYLRRGDLRELLEFRLDPYVSETSGMGGPLRFTIRDHALHVLTVLTNCKVEDAGDCFTDTTDGRGFFRSWSPFLNWFDKHEREFR